MARVCYATCKIVQSAWRSHSQGAASGSQLPGAFGIHKAQARASDGSWGHTCTLYLHKSMCQVTEVGPQCMPACLLWQVKWTADARAMREVQHMPGSALPAVAHHQTWHRMCHTPTLGAVACGRCRNQARP